jgi:hypothetical protein
VLTQIVGKIVVTLEYFDDMIQHPQIYRELCGDLLQYICAVLGRNLKMSSVLFWEAAAGVSEAHPGKNESRNYQPEEIVLRAGDLHGFDDVR